MTAPASRTGIVLEAVDVKKTYPGGVEALRGVSMQIAAGQIVGLLGRNGAGKSTLVSIIAGVLPPDSGAVVERGGRLRVGYAPQDTGVYPMLTVRENLRYFARLYGLAAKDVERQIGRVAELLSIGPLLDRLAGRLSGGEKRRLHTGLALLHDPQVLLLDEPTVGADVDARRQILEVVKGLAANGTAVLYTTHYLREVEELGAHVAILEDGDILIAGDVDELIAERGSHAVELRFRSKVTAVPFEGATIEGTTVRVPVANAAADLPRVLDAIPVRDRARLEGVSIVSSDLESVYLSLVGRRFDGDDAAAGTETTLAS